MNGKYILAECSSSLELTAEPCLADTFVSLQLLHTPVSKGTEEDFCAWVWWHTPLIPALGRMRQEDCKFEVSPSDTGKLFKSMSTNEI